MKKATLYVIAIPALAAVLGFALVWQPQSTSDHGTTITRSPADNVAGTSKTWPDDAVKPVAEDFDDWFQQAHFSIREALDAGQFSSALAQFDANYSRANSAQLERLTNLIIQRGEQLIETGQHADVIRLLAEFADTFDDQRAWDLLVRAYRGGEQWNDMLHALQRSNQLETDAIIYRRNLRQMVVAASKISTQHERDGDLLATLQLYQQLYLAYPQHPRFQFDLAKAHLALGANTEARSLLEGLVYDPDIGVIASKQLEIIDQLSSENPGIELDASAVAQSAGNEIVVPLRRAGSSFLVDTMINNSEATLLLDTGASITALSAQQIQGLNLSRLNRTAQISTANGVINAPLYIVESLTLGPVTLQNVTVAEIQFSSGSRINGLLGTDVLRSLNNRYSYLIDDQRGALVFKLR